jgi:hypothetical protein
MILNVEQVVESELAGETKILGVSLPQCLFVHQKSQITSSLRWFQRESDKHLIHDMAFTAMN